MATTTTTNPLFTQQHIAQYFQLDAKSKCVYFTGNTLHIYIPARYEEKKLLTVTDTVNSIAIFDMRIDNKIDTGFLLAASIDIEYSKLTRETINDEPHVVLELKQGDKFLKSTDYIKNDKLGYILWVEFIALGRLPRFVTYDNVVWLFDTIAEAIGINFNVNHSVFEMLYAHLFRDANDLSIKYRLTPMKEPPTMIELRNVAYGPDDTMSKVLGSYMSVGLNAALITESTEPSPIEIQLRS